MLRTTLGLLLLPFISLSLARHPWAPHIARQADPTQSSRSSLLVASATSASSSSSGVAPSGPVSSSAAPSTVPDSAPSDAGDEVYDVIILGGGIAGISAARTLILSHNITNILLLEARPELGGRAHTEYLTNAEGEKVTVEKGCNWIQGPGKEVIQELADKWGLESTPTNYSDVVFFQAEWSEEEEDVQSEEAQGRRGRFLTGQEAKNFTEGYDAFLEAAPGYSEKRANASLVDLSVRVATSILDWIPTTAMQMLYEYWNVDFTFAQTPEQSSFANAFGQEAGVANSQDRFVIDQRGYKYIFIQEAKEIFGESLSDPRLHLNTTVTTIDYSAMSDTTAANGSTPGEALIKVTTDKGTFNARYVISTLSIGVLQNQDVKWEPSLPDWKKEAIFSFSMATYQKIFMMFPEQFWGDTEFILRGDPDVRGRFAVWQNVNAPGYFPANTSSNVIMVTAIDALAREYENLSDADISDQAMLVLREMYGPSIPSPTSIVVPRWTLDPLYRGSYSNWPIGVLDQHHSNLRQPVGGDRVWFTGEAMSEEAFGYVQGAWNEGAATAKAIGECLVDGLCEGAEIYPALKVCEQEAQTEQPFKDGASTGGGKNKGAAMRHGLPGAAVRQKRSMQGL